MKFNKKELKENLEIVKLVLEIATLTAGLIKIISML